jgi:hypothetical protein
MAWAPLELHPDGLPVCPGQSSAQSRSALTLVILARGRQDAIVTSDPHDLRRLDPAARIIAV